MWQLWLGSKREGLIFPKPWINGCYGVKSRLPQSVLKDSELSESTTTTTVVQTPKKKGSNKQGPAEQRFKALESEVHSIKVKSEANKGKKQASSAELAEAKRASAKRKLAQNKYLLSLMNPIGYGPAKIPDLACMKSTTFTVRQVIALGTSATGEGSLIVNPWFNRMYATNNSATPYSWSAYTAYDASQAAAIATTFASARIVSGMATVRFRGAIANTQGVVTGVLQNPHDSGPASYLTLTQMDGAVERPLTDGISVLWKPMDEASNRYVDTAWAYSNPGASMALTNFGNANGTALYTSVPFATWSWYSAANGGNVGLISAQNNLPYIIVGYSGCAPASPGLLEAEIVLNYEALYAQNTFQPGMSEATTSPIDLGQYQTAHMVSAQVAPVRAAVKSDDTQGFWDKALPIIGKVASSALPFLTSFL